jgi:hypothetical protein
LFIENQPSLIPQFLKEQFYDNEDEDTIDVENFDIESIFDDSKKQNNTIEQQHYYPGQTGSVIQQPESLCGQSSCGSSTYASGDGFQRFSEPPQHSFDNNPLMNPYMSMY